MGLSRHKSAEYIIKTVLDISVETKDSATSVDLYTAVNLRRLCQVFIYELYCALFYLDRSESVVARVGGESNGRMSGRRTDNVGRNARRTDGRVPTGHGQTTLGQYRTQRRDRSSKCPGWTRR